MLPPGAPAQQTIRSPGILNPFVDSREQASIPPGDICICALIAERGIHCFVIGNNGKPYWMSGEATDSWVVFLTCDLQLNSG